MASNEVRPELRNRQTFTLPVQFTIDSDQGGVSRETFMKHVQSAFDSILEQLADGLDRDPTNPMPFAFHGAQARWVDLPALNDPPYRRGTVPKRADPGW
jgi:hypothetical protein